jgi:predicted nucleic acid-binding Zn ribbon protein
MKQKREGPGRPPERCAWCGDAIPRDRPYGNYCREECRKSARMAAWRRRQREESSR